MPEMTIQLRTNPATGKKDIIIQMSKDDDALPQEHELQHRQLVEKLLSKGLVDLEELGQVVVDRGESDSGETPEETQAESPQRSSRQEDA